MMKRELFARSSHQVRKLPFLNHVKKIRYTASYARFAVANPVVITPLDLIKIMAYYMRVPGLSFDSDLDLTILELPLSFLF